MSQIPEDVMKLAKEAHARFADSRVTDNLTDIIARAILSDRSSRSIAETGEGHAPQTHVSDDDLPTLHCETTPEGGVIRLSKWPEGYVLWYHGQIVWRSWAKNPVRVRVTGFRGNPLRVVLSSGVEATISQKLVDSFASPSPFEQHPDDVAVDRFAVAMKSKLAQKRAQGMGGWDDPAQCPIDYLAHLLAEQIHSRAALDTVDIGNFAMMIYNRGETPTHGR